MSFQGQKKCWTCGKFKSLKLIERREHVQKFVCFSIVWEQLICPTTAREGHVLSPSVEGDTTDFSTATTDEGYCIDCIRCYKGSSNKHHSRKFPNGADQAEKPILKASYTSHVWFAIFNLFCREVVGVSTSASWPQIVPISSGILRLTRCQDWSSADSCFNPWELSNFDNSDIREKLMLADQIAKMQELTHRYPLMWISPKSGLQYRRDSSGSRTKLLQQESFFRFQGVRKKDATWVMKSKTCWDMSDLLPATRHSNNINRRW